MMSVYYVWNVNGNAFYAAFLSTKSQENIILSARLTLLLFLIVLYFNRSTNLDTFITFYATILFIGPILEILYLFKIKAKSNNSEARLSSIFKQSLYHHFDFLSFNIFPLFATVLLASFSVKADVGRYNFALQIMSLIFLFAATANIRVTAYVSDVGYKARIKQYKKLFWATMTLSSAAIVVLYFAISFAVNLKHFSQFEGVSTIFLICGLSVPGYIFYQFFSPIWIEFGKQKYSAAVHGINFLLCAAISPFVFSKYGILGAAWMFSVFHFGLLVSQGVLYFRFMRTNSPHKVAHAN
jgi:Na+-driven multidrug efflux pump